MIIIDDTNKHFISWFGNRMPVEFKVKSPNMVTVRLQREAFDSGLLEYADDKGDYCILENSKRNIVFEIYNSYKQTLIDVLKRNNDKDIKHPSRKNIKVDSIISELQLTNIKKDNAIEWIEYFYTRLITEKILSEGDTDFNDDNTVLIYRFAPDV